jgi:Spy/CpxP family protein refolding chaperone
MNTRLMRNLFSLLMLLAISSMGIAFAKDCPSKSDGSQTPRACMWMKKKKSPTETTSCSMKKEGAMGEMSFYSAYSDEVIKRWRVSLGLKPEQEAQLNTLEAQYKAEVAPLDEKTKKAKHTMMEYLACPSLEKTAMSALIDEYTASKNELLKTRMDYYYLTLNLLTPEQVKKSREFWASYHSPMNPAKKP